MKGGGREASLWWHDLYALRREEWFHDNVSHSVFFWSKQRK